ncbi:hypothetical protein DIPPA_03883 [Diplonema papillatum]|nr:hypothetical protein DIPPA_03883 [Diplonema papillatum]
MVSFGTGVFCGINLAAKLIAETPEKQTNAKNLAKYVAYVLSALTAAGAAFLYVSSKPVSAGAHRAQLR